ncbi:syntaxin-6-like [Actinia tenebrosa]|uniref:Syntaxin-6-like n=1 Tax=Actinia tenebrosa TaxID=6105 RepID=A0A6P8I6M6_ACTTE|nr:syntaxin-6-like [Actinia tenebrosa]
MSLEDPFFVVRDEVQKAVNKVRELYSRWKELLNDPRMAGREEYDWTTNELKNNIRSIEWDLEDLDETIGIVEANPRKFNMDISELNKRKLFVKQTRDDMTSIKEHLNSPSARTKLETSTRQALLGNRNGKPQDKYSRLDREIERSNQTFIDDQQQQQSLLMQSQDEQIEMVGHSVGVLKTMGKKIGDEIEDQNLILDDFGHELEMTDSKLNQVVLKVEKVLRLSDDKRQCYVLISLIVIMVIVIILFIVL